jgi:DNA modification methylase
MAAVVDPFLGSGSTMAVDKAGRVCGGVELDPLYANVIVRHYESATDSRAILPTVAPTCPAPTTPIFMPLPP